MQSISARCCVVGGGPAGMMAGYLLARAGIDVVALEKHADFLRDFRGDAAHAMSPISGVGINMAIQDAVAAANMLTPVLKRDAPVPDSVLDAVRRHRLLPTRVTQAFQIAVQNRVLVPALAGVPLKIPFAIKLLDRSPWLRGLPARFLGIGVRPEHVKRGPA